MLRWFRTILGTCALCVFLYSGWHVVSYYREAKANKDLTNDLMEAAVVVTEESANTDADSTAAVGKTTGKKETPPITVDFEALQTVNPEIFAWLYCEGTNISYPVAHGDDNEKYLRTLPDGSYNTAGTLFSDYRSETDMSSWNTVIYGHNMENDSMFGTLYSYNNAGYYEEHPAFWLITQDASYKIELFAGYDTPDDSEIYTFFENSSDAYAMAKQAEESSVFSAAVSPRKGDHFLTLSTCSYSYENARFVLMGRLINCG